MNDRQAQWAAERRAYLARLLQSAEARGDKRAVARLERELESLSTFSA